MERLDLPRARAAGHACPCALVIATPVTIVSGLTAMARLGVLIKSGTVLESASMTLMKDDLRKVANSIHLGCRVVSIIRFNVTFALLVKAVFLTLAFLGYAGLWMAILADTGATLLVIVNSLRLLKSPERHENMPFMKSN